MIAIGVRGPVAVVGGGVAGARAAGVLQDAGVPVLLLDGRRPVWGIDLAGRPDGLFELHRTSGGNDVDVVHAASIVLATGAGLAPLPIQDPPSRPDLMRPRAESALGRSIGCRASWSRDRGGWLLDVDSGMRTTVPGVLAIGAVTGARTRGDAEEQALLAVESLLERNLTFTRRAAPGDDDSEELTALYRNVPDALLICPCEGVRLGQVRATGASVLREVKLATRLGMGACQGRVCGHLMAGLDEVEGRAPTPLQPRAPIVPLTIPLFDPITDRNPR